MNDIEQRLSDHLANEAKSATSRNRLDEVLSRGMLVRAVQPPVARAWFRPALAAAAVVAVTVGGLAIATRAPSDSDPATADGSAPDLPDDIPANGIDWTPQDSLALDVATQTLVQECMAAAGWKYDIVDPAELALVNGAWSPHPVLSVGTVDAAYSYGYHPADPPSDGLTNFVIALPANQQSAFYTALNGSPIAPESDPGAGDDVEITTTTIPNNRPTTVLEPGQNPTGCSAAPNRVFGALLQEQEAESQFLNEARTDSERVAGEVLRDDEIIDALDAWRVCVADATGETDDTPNELARRYSFDPEVTDREIEVAVADARCQADIDLTGLWGEVYARYQRQALGTDSARFDSLALLRLDIIERANVVISDRGIELAAG